MSMKMIIFHRNIICTTFNPEQKKVQVSDFVLQVWTNCVSFADMELMSSL